MTERRDFHRLPTGAWTSEGPAPVDSPWKSLGAPISAEAQTRDSGHQSKTRSYTI